jgi:hypothetical protein
MENARALLEEMEANLGRVVGGDDTTPADKAYYAADILRDVASLITRTEKTSEDVLKQTCPDLNDEERSRLFNHLTSRPANEVLTEIANTHHILPRWVEKCADMCKVFTNVREEFATRVVDKSVLKTKFQQSLRPMSMGEWHSALARLEELRTDARQQLNYLLGSNDEYPALISHAHGKFEKDTDLTDTPQVSLSRLGWAPRDIKLAASIACNSMDVAELNELVSQFREQGFRVRENKNDYLADVNVLHNLYFISMEHKLLSAKVALTVSMLSRAGISHLK